MDSYYCPNCLENMASAEAKMRKHRCGNCFDCPSCGHTLSTRATAVVHAKPDEPGRTTAQKAYFLACGFCRWITRDSGIPDQQQAAGGWQEKISPHFKRVCSKFYLLLLLNVCYFGIIFDCCIEFSIMEPIARNHDFRDYHIKDHYLCSYCLVRRCLDCSVFRFSYY